MKQPTDLNADIVYSTDVPMVDVSHAQVVDALTYYLIGKTNYQEKLGTDGVRLLAEAAVATDAIVFPESVCELTLFPESEMSGDNLGEGGERYVFHLGYNFWKRMAYEQQGDCSVYQMRQLNTQEKRVTMGHGGRPLLANDLAYECTIIPLARSEYCMEKWGISFGTYLEQMAPVGLGWVSAQEMENRRLPKGRTWEFIAQKRAEVAAMKQVVSIRPPAVTRYHLMFGFVKIHAPQLELTDITMTRPNELAIRTGREVKEKLAADKTKKLDANDILF
jgi:hypothetical protein